MSTALHILGGLAQGIGGGMVLQGQQAAREREAEAGRRHEMALENTRNQNQRANIQLNADLGDRNSERADQRGDYYDARKTTRTTASQIAVDNNRSERRETEAQNDHGRAVSMAQLQSALQTQSATTQARVNAQIQSGQISDVVQDRSGRYFGITRTGQRVDLGIDGAAPATTGIGGGSILQQAGGAGAGAAPGPVLNWNPRTGQFE